MDDPGLIYFEQVSLDKIMSTKYAANLWFEDKVCSQYDLDHWPRTCKIIHLGHVQEHFRCAKVSNCSLRRSRLRCWMDYQLFLLPSPHMCSYHRVHRAILWEQMRQDCSYVLSPPCMFGHV
jgi:hypothetical protein